MAVLYRNLCCSEMCYNDAELYKDKRNYSINEQY